MRTDGELYELIVNAANEDERIRAAIMTGSRANPECPHDIYQDFDIVYIVKDVAPFYNNVAWVEEHFGKPLIMQLPELMKHPLLPPDGDGHFVYLTIFREHYRMDITFDTKLSIDDGEPSVVLVDKDGEFGGLKGSPSVFHVKRPDGKLYADVCNEFWWCLNNVGKGIARGEIPYAKAMFDIYVRDMLNEMVKWYIGTLTGYGVSAGKLGKYFKRCLPEDIYRRYIETYSGGESDELWRAVDTACALFRELAKAVAEREGFIYNEHEDAGMTEYLSWVREGE